MRSTQERRRSTLTDSTCLSVRVGIHWIPLLDVFLRVFLFDAYLVFLEGFIGSYHGWFAFLLSSLELNLNCNREIIGLRKKTKNWTGDWGGRMETTKVILDVVVTGFNRKKLPKMNAQPLSDLSSSPCDELSWNFRLGCVPRFV